MSRTTVGHRVLRSGDRVRVRSLGGILSTLDPRGMLDDLPFMREMAEFCGQAFQVARRAEKTCVEGSREGVREFKNNDVVILEDLRCSGAAHGGCQRACVFFWKEAWLEPVPEPNGAPATSSAGDAGVLSRLDLPKANGHYVCQSTQLKAATITLPQKRRVVKCVRDVRYGTVSIPRMIKLVWGPVWEKIKQRLAPSKFGGPLTRTPTESLHLQPGEWVEVKPWPEIVATLDHLGRNRGMGLGPSLHCLSGRRFKVRDRLENMILETTGEMRHLENTVTLEGAICDCCKVLGGCPRADLIFWREIWLRRVMPEENSNCG